MKSETRDGAAVHYGRAPLIVLAATVALEAGERQALAQAVTGLQAEFGISDGAMGLLPAAMAVMGLLGAVPFGILADRVRRTLLLGGGMALWAVCMLANVVAPGYGFLFAARMGLGAVEANSPAAISLLADYYPVRFRARAMGLYQSGALVGTLVGLVLGGIVVGAFGWRWAFAMWVIPGILVAIAMVRLREPERGAQDVDFQVQAEAGAMRAIDAKDLELNLPAPAREGLLDYRRVSNADAFRELVRIPTMWLGVMALTISSILLNGLQFWGVEFFKRAHGLSAAQAGIATAVFGLGAAVGVLGGGFLADRLLRRGILNARVYVVSFSSIIAAAVLVPAFLAGSLVAAVPLFFIGGALLTMPIAPGEAMVTDVVVSQLRGRAATLRAIVRSIGAASPVVVGVLSDRIGLGSALATVVPLYAVGGLLVLLALRTYPGDLAYVASESRRWRADLLAHASAHEEGTPR
jgi:predicted MFS family arabinose efflux permease